MMQNILHQHKMKKQQQQGNKKKKIFQNFNYWRFPDTKLQSGEIIKLL